MRLGKHRPGPSSTRRRWAYLPAGDTLEERRLLSAAVDLATTQSSNLGVQFIGKGVYAGYTVTDVGNTTGSGYDDFVVAAPGLAAPTTGAPTFTGTSTVYLVFGSKQVNVSSFSSTNWLQLAPGQRGADLAQLGTLGTPPAIAQVNPTIAQPAPPAVPITGYNFDGLTFTTGTTANSGLGFSVAALGDINGDGLNDFAIGAPNEAGGGAVYIIYGSAGLTSIPIASKSINLDSTAGQAVLSGVGRGDLKFVGSSLPGTPGAQGNQVGYSVAGLGNFLNPGTIGLAGTLGYDIAIGVPGLNSDTGAVFALSGNRLTSLVSGSTTDLSTTLGTTGYANEYTGINVGDRVGASVASGGNFDGARTTTGNLTVDDLLIGAPGVGSGTGAAYLVYGIQNTVNNILPATSTLGQVVSLSQLALAPATIPPFNNPLQGLVFSGGPTNLFGFSVSSAGDFNGDGYGDIIIGAPSGAGSASIYYGQGPLSNRYTGNYGASAIPPLNPVGTVPALPLPLIFTGAPALSPTPTIPGDLVGFSVSYVGDIPGEGINGVLIGAPGSNNGAGEAYVVPGNYASTGTPAAPNAAFPSQVALATAIGNPTYAILPLVLTGSTAGGPAYLGTSVSGRQFFLPTQAATVDADKIPDVFVGAPGFSFTAPNANTPGRVMAGAGFALQGAFLPVGIPNNVLLTSAGVNSNNPTGTYTLTATGSATFYIFSTAATGTTPAFDPTVDLTSPITLTINGVTFTNITLTKGKDSTGANDVSFALTAAQVASLGLVGGSTATISIRGTTNAAGGSAVFVAKAAGVTVTAGGGGGGGGGAGIAGPTALTILAPPIFTGLYAGQPYPPVSQLEHLTTYQPIPVTIAYQQFLAQPGFLAREEVYHHPSKAKGAHQAPRGSVLYVAAIGYKSENKYSKKNTLPHATLSRSKFTYGKSITFTHKVKVIPRSQQTETFSA